MRRPIAQHSCRCRIEPLEGARGPVGVTDLDRVSGGGCAWSLSRWHHSSLRVRPATERRSRRPLAPQRACKPSASPHHLLGDPVRTSAPSMPMAARRWRTCQPRRYPCSTRTAVRTAHLHRVRVGGSIMRRRSPVSAPQALGGANASIDTGRETLSGRSGRWDPARGAGKRGEPSWADRRIVGKRKSIRRHCRRITSRFSAPAFVWPCYWLWLVRASFDFSPLRGGAVDALRLSTPCDVCGANVSGTYRS
jgi:hypothetical protein